MSLHYDIYVHILSHLPPSRIPHHDDSVNTLVACLQSSHLIRQAASSPSIWESHYRERYTHPPIPTGTGPSHDWKSNYFERRRRDRQALHHLDSLVREATDWDNIWSTGLFTFEVWDVLELEAQYHSLDILTNTTLDNGHTDKPRSLTYGYWASGLLRTIARIHAVETLRRLLSDPTGVSFEESHGVLSMFLGESPYRMGARFEDLALQCRTYIESTAPGISFSNYMTIEMLRDACTHIHRFMCDQGFGPAEAAEFSQILNSFPHAYLSTHRKTIPMSLVHVFVAIATRLGLSAQPVNFPGRVIARVLHDEEFVYVDVYGPSDKAILPVSNDRLVDSLEFLPFHLQQGASLSRLSNRGVDMLIRASRNIYHFSQASPDYSVLGQFAVDTASCIAIALTGEAGLVHFLLREGSSPHPLDSYVLLPQLAGLVPSTNTSQLLRSAYQMAQDIHASTRLKLHSRSTHPHVRYFVGMFFIHKTYDYLGCVLGWEPVCTASQQWVDQNGVAQLQRGRNQPFYTSIALGTLTSGGTQTFVAEDNIVPVPLPSGAMVKQFIDHYRDFGRHFEDVDYKGQTVLRMRPSPFLRRVFPDDDAFATSFIFPVAELSRRL